eukprot:scaffold32563_cov60-Cyclotella_meneghiniana.AAC.3
MQDCGRLQDNAIDSRPPDSKYPTRRRAEGFGRSHGGGRRQGTVRIARCCSSTSGHGGRW